MKVQGHLLKLENVLYNWILVFDLNCYLIFHCLFYESTLVLISVHLMPVRKSSFFHHFTAKGHCQQNSDVVEQKSLQQSIKAKFAEVLPCFQLLSFLNRRRHRAIQQNLRCLNFLFWSLTTSCLKQQSY